MRRNEKTRQKFNFREKINHVRTSSELVKVKTRTNMLMSVFPIQYFIYTFYPFTPMFPIHHHPFPNAS